MKKRLVYFAILSVFSLMLSSCSERDYETYYKENSIIEIEIPQPVQIGLNSCPVELKDVYAAFMHDSRNTIDVPCEIPNAYVFYDEENRKTTYAIEHPAKEDAWLLECVGEKSNKRVIQEFEQIEENEYRLTMSKDNYVRYIGYDPRTNEIIARSCYLQGRKMSDEDRFLCNTAFTTAGYLLGAILALPTGGVSLSLTIGVSTIGFYVCE